ncbi:MAG: hypothetical protein C5B49_14960 [Bdellovibrio sp.]|nr:MAG: hypothetical protein C5B49_14960 [Bdellovibrio sp.]
MVMLLSLGSLVQAKKDFGLPAVDQPYAQIFEGQLFTVKIVPQDQQTQFFVVGKEAGKFNMADLTLDVTTINSDGKQETLPLRREKEAFVMDHAMDPPMRPPLSRGEIKHVVIKKEGKPVDNVHVNLKRP